MTTAALLAIIAATITGTSILVIAWLPNARLTPTEQRIQRVTAAGLLIALAFLIAALAMYLIHAVSQ